MQTMSAQYSEKARRLMFLHRSCSMTGTCLNCWLEDAEFVAKISELVESGVKIDDKVLLEVIRPLLAARTANKKDYPGFKIQNARRGMHQLERAVLNH